MLIDLHVLESMIRIQFAADLMVQADPSESVPNRYTHWGRVKEG